MTFLPEYFVLPHPSWRTIGWLRDNPWFENEALPDLRTRIGRVLDPRRSIGGLDALRPRTGTTAADSIPQP